MPMIFNTEYELKVNLSRDDSVKLFNEHFDNMDKKGYSHSTLILNSDHNSKDFSGVIRDNTFLVRLCRGYSDLIYRYSPLHKIRFIKYDDCTKISVKCFNSRATVFFILISVIFAVSTGFSILSVMNNILPLFVNILFVLVPLIIMTVIALISKSQLTDFKSSLIFAYKDSLIK